MTKRRAATLIELLIVVTIIAVLAIGTMVLLNPFTITSRGIDTRRKADLDTFKKALEEFYTDKGCYPKPSDVCFPSGQNGDLSNKSSCIVCGTEDASPSLSSYLEKLPCDPGYPANNYLYVIEETELSCPKSYSLYSRLSIPNDSESIRLGCGKGGCGIAPNYSYDYAVTSPNSSPKTTNYFLCFSKGGTCDNCVQPGYANNYDACLHNISCQGADSIYATVASCCKAHPTSTGCH